MLWKTPIENRCLSVDPQPFLQVDDEKTKKNQGRIDQLHLLAAILARWRCLVTSNEALNLLYQAMRAVLYRRTTTAIKRVSLFGTFFHHRFIFCCPGSHWGNTEQVVAQWWCPVASGVALDMMHWAICFELHRRTTMAIKMDGRQGTFDCHR